MSAAVKRIVLNFMDIDFPIPEYENNNFQLGKDCKTE